MNLENKQRLVGVIVLVAFIALLIPFLFTNGIKTRQTTNTGEDLIPIEMVENNTQDVNDKIVAPQEQVTTDVNANTANSVESQVISIDKSSDGSQSAPTSDVTVPNEGVINTAGNTAVVSSDVATSITNTEETSSVEKPKTSKKIIKNKKSKTTNKNVKKNKEFWSVQVGSFAEQQRVKQLVSQLQANKFSVYLQKIATSRGVMVRVLIGRVTNKDQANKLEQQLQQKLGIKGCIVKNKK